MISRCIMQLPGIIRVLTNEYSVIGVGHIVLLVSCSHFAMLCTCANVLQGIKRQTECRYAHVANLLEYVISHSV